MTSKGGRIDAKRKAFVYEAPTKRLYKKTKLYKTDSVEDIKKLLGNDSQIVISDEEVEIRDEADELYDSIFNNKQVNTKGDSGVDAVIKKLRSPTVVIDADSSEEEEAKDDQSKDDLIDILRNDQILVKRTQLKYSQKKFNPKVYTKKQLLSKIHNYYEIIPKILNGDLESYFYGLGLKLMKESKHETIQSWEFRNLPLNLLQCGYIGKKRSMIIKRKIFLKFNPILTTSKDKVVRYFGIDNFITYILLPELVSFFVKDEFKLSNVDKAIDLMEVTNDYGLYIMDKIDPREQEYDSDVDDDEEMKLTKKLLNIVQEPVDNFVQNIIGFSDEDSEEEG